MGPATRERSGWTGEGPDGRPDTGSRESRHPDAGDRDDRGPAELRQMGENARRRLRAATLGDLRRWACLQGLRRWAWLRGALPRANLGCVGG